MIKDTTKAEMITFMYVPWLLAACPIKKSRYKIYRSRVLRQRRFRGISIAFHYLDCSMCFALWEGFLHHGPSQRAVVLGNG